MDTAISIPDDVFERAEQRAAALGMSRDEFYTAALADFIGEASDEEITESLNRFYTDHSSELDPALVQMQAVSLGKEEW